MSRPLHRSPPATPLPLIQVPLLAACLLALWGCSPASPDAADRPADPVPVLVAAVVPDTEATPEFIGEVRARQRAELAFAVPGVVRQVLVEAGDVVRRGQLLATLDPTPSQAQLDMIQADLRRQEAAVEEARRKVQRLKQARDQQAAGDAEWTAAQTELSVAESALAATKAQREGSTWNRAQAELRAPFDGQVAARHLEVGQSVGAGLAALSLDGAGRELWAVLPAELKDLRVGQAVRIASTQNDASVEWDSQLLRLSGRHDVGDARRAVFALPGSLPVGQTLSLRLLAASTTASRTWVPLRALQGAPESRPAASGEVLRVNADGTTVSRVRVQLGQAQDQRVEVLAGLNPGDRVVIAGGHSLAADVRVKPVTQLR